MTGDRRLRILTRLGSVVPRELETQRLCEVCVEVTDLTGAGIMLMSEDLPRGSVSTSNAVSALIEQLQFELGEGPCVDAYQQDRPILEPDLAAPRVPRWLAFRAPALRAGVGAIFAFPLEVGAIRLGALCLYADRPGPLSDDQYADALVLADIVTQALLAIQANAPPGKLATELEAGADFHYVVHQASGMVAAQLDVNVSQALFRLRAYAFGHERPLDDVANDIVARRLRFDGDSKENEATS
jgi:GAF domain-containing protein